MTWPEDASVQPKSLWPPAADDEYEGRRRRSEPEPAPPVDPVAPPTSLRTKAARRGAILLAVVVGLPVTVIGIHLSGAMGSPDSPSPRPSARQGYTEAPGLAAPMPTVPTADPSELASASASPSASASVGAASGGATTSSSPNPPTSPGSSSSPQPGGGGGSPLLVDNFDGNPSWGYDGGGWGGGWGGGYGGGWSPNYQRGRNDLGQFTEADVFAGVTLANGALTLTYADDGWFGSHIDRSAEAYAYLVIRVRGGSGGEQHHVRLTVGGVQRMLADVTVADGTRAVITTTYRDLRIPMVANGINRAAPGELQLDFWHGGSGSISIDEIRFE